MAEKFSRRTARSGDNQFIVKKRRRILFVGLVVVLLAVAAWFALRQREPEHKGRKLSEWLGLNSVAERGTDTRFEASAAIRAIGTNAIPKLLIDIKAKDPPWRGRAVQWVTDKLGLDLDPYLATPRRQRAIAGFGALGQIAESAEPELRKLAEGTELETARNAMKALCAISAESSLPVLINALTNSNVDFRVLAIQLLGGLRAEAQEAVPALVAVSEGNDSQLRPLAFRSLGEIVCSPELAVPAIARGLEDHEMMVRFHAVRALAGFGNRAAAFIPAIQGRLDDKNKVVRHNAALTLIRAQCTMREGAIVRGPASVKQIVLVFTGHEFAEGGATILDHLAKHEGRASFFLTGDFLNNPEFGHLINRIVDDGHYLGPHSDKHLLYSAWSNEAQILVSKDEFHRDLLENARKVLRIASTRAKWPGYFLPPFEHYNRTIADWTRECGWTLINFTPGTRSNADYTGEADKNFVSAQAIFDSIVQKEREDPHGLNGFILLLHLGSGPGRKDKFHDRFGELLDYLADKGYQFVRVDELLEPKESP